MASRAEHTRSRILDASLMLFNERGERNVAISDVAHELGISPGNLHYHFPHKNEIVSRLFEQFRDAVVPALAVPRGRAAHAEDLWLFLHMLFEQVRDYRFLFRDLDDLLARDRRLKREFAKLLNDVAATAGRLMRGLAAEGALEAGTREIDALAEGTAMTIAYWMSYRGIRGDALRGDIIGRGVYQAMAALAPYLRGDARALFVRLAGEYLGEDA
ncbi:MAG TPA: TetR/AcrR family transcriptional regulator [Burkholderiales bacterium]|nr:TetR/AcrR family transcriptional regulator [Burkholderiales bacterium]